MFTHLPVPVSVPATTRVAEKGRQKQPGSLAKTGHTTVAQTSKKTSSEAHVLSATEQREDKQAKSAAFLKLVEVADVDLQTQVFFESLRTLITRFPALLPAESSLDQISEQFCLYQVTDISKEKADRLDVSWAGIGQNSDFQELSLVMRGILTIPHSSAPCERIFSYVRKNKTPQRASLTTVTLESLLVLKNKGDDPLAALKGLNNEDLKEMKSAYTKSLKSEVKT